MTVRSGVLACLGGTIVLVALGPAARGAEIYRAATVLEDRVGKIRMASTFEVPLDVRGPCDSEPGWCPGRIVDAEVLGSSS